MPCERMNFRMKDGTEVQAFVCTRSPRRSLPCVVCGKPYTKLCDGKPGAWPNIKTSSGTCSAPLCDAHAHHVAPDRDYCPLCIPTPNAGRTGPGARVAGDGYGAASGCGS